MKNNETPDLELMKKKNAEKREKVSIFPSEEG